MNCPNNCGELATTTKGFECPKCHYSMSLPKPKKAKVGSAVEEVNARIRADLLAASMSDDPIAPWQQPWFSVPKQNWISGRAYNGINRFMLPDTCEFYLTGNKIKELAGVKESLEQYVDIRDLLVEDAQPLTVVTWIPPRSLSEKQKASMTEAEIALATRRRFPVMVLHEVFRYTDVKNLPARKVKTVGEKIHDRIPNGEAFLTKLRAMFAITEAGNKAQYSQSDDKVHVPKLERFNSYEEYFLAYAHECAHATGSPARLNRYQGEKDAKAHEAYGKEELVAQITACYLAGIFGVSIPKNGTAYIQHWMKAIEGDSYMLISASQQAEKAIAFLLK